MEIVLGRHAVARRVYMDANATTPPKREVVEAMSKAALGAWGNPSAGYAEGAEARRSLDWARDTFARLMGGVDPACVHFTSGGTESNNVAIRSVARKALDESGAFGRNVIVTSSVEHPSVKRTAATVRGCEHVQVRVDERGYVDEAHFVEILNRYHGSLCLVSIILAQNEVGTMQAIPRLVALTRRICPRAVFHTDATQLFGKDYVDPVRLGVDLLTASAHKFHGPRGVGLLYAKKGLIDPECSPMTGGGQEGGCRSGTENVAAIVGAAVALQMAIGDERDWARRHVTTRTNRNAIGKALKAAIPGLLFNGDPMNGLGNTLSVSFPGGVHGHAMAQMLDEQYGVSLGSGSACSKGKPSETLQAMFAGRLGEKESFERIHATLRISLTQDTTADESAYAADSIVAVWRQLTSRATAN